MGRIIAIDYGKKRTGIAVTDPLKIIAGGLTTVPSYKLIAFLKDYIKTEDVELILIGEPRNMDYNPSENLNRVEKIKQQIIKSIPTIPIKSVDERFTSVLAQRAMIDGGLKKTARQNKELVDQISATIILQTYLEYMIK